MPQGWKLWSMLPIGAILNVQIITLLFPFTAQKYIYPPVTKVHARSFHVSVIHQTLTWSIGSLIHVCTWSFLWVRIHMGVGHSQHNIFDLEKLTIFFLCSWWDSNLVPLDLESALYPLSHPVTPSAFDDDAVVLYSAVTPSYCGLLSALGRVVSLLPMGATLCANH